MHGKGVTRTLFVFTLVGLVLFALGGAAMAAPPDDLGNVGQNGPTPPKLGDPVAFQSEVQWMTFTVAGGVPSGTFTLAAADMLNSPTAAVAVGASAGTVQSALRGSSTGPVPGPASPYYPLRYGATAVAVFGGPTSVDFDANGVLTGGTDGAFYYRVQWTSSTNWALLSVNGGALVNASATVAPYEDGLAYTGRVQPHGGYSAVTDYCLQCHTVHNAPGEGFSLLADTSVTATCKTCHVIGVAIDGNSPPNNMSAINPGFPGVEAPTSMRGSYEVTGAAALSKHTLGSTNIPFGTVDEIYDAGWSYGGFSAAGWTANQGPAGAGTVDSLNGGLYCGSCHTPHGDFGQLVNSERAGFRSTADGGALDFDVDTWTELTPFYLGRSFRVLHKDVSAPDGSTQWLACPPTNNAAYSATGSTVSPIAPVGADINAVANNFDTVTQGVGGTVACGYLTATDTEGESAFLYGYKLLTAYPNHEYDNVESWAMDASNHDGARWCGACHDEATPSEYGGTFHNHPTGCTACHGNPNDATSSDFPHTSTFDDLLKDYPDLLCINCHTAGSLP